MTQKLMRRLSVALTGLAICVACAPARGQTTPPPDEDTSYSSQWRLWLSGGYARLGSNGDTILDNVDGWYLDAQFAKRINASAPWWIGLSLSTSYYKQDNTVPTGTTGVDQEIQA